VEPPKKYESTKKDESDALRDAWTDAAELVHRIRRGDKDAEAELVNRYRRGVTAIVAKAGQGRVPVEDLCQDVLTTVIEKIRADAVRGPERLSGFIAGLARTMAIDYVRKDRARSAIEARMPMAPTAQAPDAVRQLLEQERASIVRAVLAELESTRDREILFRFYLAEDDKEQICRDLGLTAVHFNRVLFRARERYRELYRRWTAERGLGERPR
jgi:RNA polymerase sigma-70 factor (ECF subfamily)